VTAVSEEAPPAHAGGALRRGRAARRWLLFGSVAAVVVAADQVSKAWVDATFPLGVATPVLGDLVRIAKTYNEGGIFGLFGASATVLGLASLVVIAVIVAYQARQGTRTGPLLSLTLGLLLGGAVGNLIDRLRFAHVVDWVDMGIGTFRWYTFNVADAALSTAILLLVVMSIVGDRMPLARPDPADAEAAG
jgi:signal peptidase II